MILPEYKWHISYHSDATPLGKHFLLFWEFMSSSWKGHWAVFQNPANKTKGKQSVHRSLFRCPQILNHSPSYLSPLCILSNWITIGFYNVIYKMSWHYDLQTSFEYHIKHNSFPYYTIIRAMQIESIHY